jgi:probable HAF family extracellular repeat protein
MSAHRLALLATLALAPAAGAQVIYNVQEIPGLPIPGARLSQVSAINNRGQVVGTTDTSDATVNSRAFRWSPTTGAQNLGTLPGAGASIASGINDAGQVAGAALLSGVGFRAFRYTDGVGMVDLGVLPGQTSSLATAINNAGQVTGLSNTPPSPGVPIRYTDGVGMQSLGLPPGASGASSGTAINSRGQGATTASVSGVSRAFRYTDGTGWQDLGTASGANANAINDAGQVAGVTSGHAYLYTDGTGLRDLGVLPGGTFSEANGLNNLGQVVGYGNVTGGALHALLYSDGALRDLNGLISPQSGWVLIEAVDINDNGWIVGTGGLNGRNAMFLLTPVPEPSGLALAVIGASALYLIRRRRLLRRPANERLTPRGDQQD